MKICQRSHPGSSEDRAPCPPTYMELGRAGKPGSVHRVRGCGRPSPWDRCFLGQNHMSFPLREVACARERLGSGRISQGGDTDFLH